MLFIPSGTDSDKLKCCTVQGTTQYNTDYLLDVQDPQHITNTSSPQYSACGRNGGSKCTTYNYDDNEQGFTYFKIRDQYENGLRKMDKFVCEHNCDGLTHEAGTCDYGEAQVYEHVHVGKGYCNNAIVTLGHHCDSNYGYSCQ